MDSFVRALGTGVASSAGAVSAAQRRGRREAETEHSFEQEMRRHDEHEAPSAEPGAGDGTARDRERRFVAPTGVDEVGSRIDLVA